MKRTTIYVAISALIAGIAGAQAPILGPVNSLKEPSIQLSLDKTPIETMLDMYGELTGHSIMLTPDVRFGVVTAKTDGKATEAEALLLMEAQLKALKLAVLPATNRVAIIHRIDAAPALPKRSLGRPQQDEAKPSIKMNFQQSPLDEVLFLYFNLVAQDLKIQENLKQVPITFRSRNKLTPSEALTTLEILLQLHGIKIKEVSKDLIDISGPTRASAAAARQGATPTPSGADRHLQQYQKHVRKEGLPLLPIGLPDKDIKELEKRSRLMKK